MDRKRRQLLFLAALSVWLILPTASGTALAQGRGGGGGIGGGAGGSSISGGIGGGNISGGSSFSGGSSQSGGGSGFRTQGLSTQLNRGGTNSADPFAATRSSPFGTGQFGGQNFAGGFQGGIQGGLNFGNNRSLGGFSGNIAGNMGSMNRAGTRLQTSALPSSFRPIPPAFPDISARLETMLTNLSAPSERRNIELDLDGSTLVLRGGVTNERERQLAESLVRLEPGVYDIRNELTVLPRADPPPQPQPRPQKK